MVEIYELILILFNFEIIFDFNEVGDVVNDIAAVKDIAVINLGIILIAVKVNGVIIIVFLLLIFDIYVAVVNKIIIKVEIYLIFFFVFCLVKVNAVE